MTQRNLAPPTLIEDDRALERLLEDLDGERVVAIDTEADGFHSYRENVCLVQVTAGERDYIIDPLAEVDLHGLGEVLADPKRIKLFHDSEFDVLILKRDFGFSFAALFDTRVAAAILGSKSPGLASVLHDHFGVELDKSMQRSDWSKRPLSPEQISYARLDTHYLVELYERQAEELEAQGLTMVLDTECRRLEGIEPPSHAFRPDDWVRVKGARHLRPQARAILRELFILRDRLAQERDVPPFRVISNHTLIDLAQQRPLSLAALGKIKGCSGLVRSRYGDDILDAIEDGLDAQPIQRMPAPPRKAGVEPMDEEASELHDRLKQVRKKAAEARNIEAAYLLHRTALARTAIERPSSESDLQRVAGLEDWQMEWFADDLLRCIDRFERDLANGTAIQRSGGRRRRSR